MATNNEAGGEVECLKTIYERTNLRSKVGYQFFRANLAPSRGTMQINLSIPGCPHQADYYLPDFDHDRSLVFTVAIQHAASHPSNFGSGSLFASAMSAFAPEVEPLFREVLEQSYVDLTLIRLPTEGPANCVYMNLKTYDAHETTLIFGICIMALFKDLTPQNYQAFVDDIKKALGGMLHMTPTAIDRVRFPFSLEKMLEIRSVFGAFRKLKRGLLIHLMNWCKMQGNLKVMAQYCCKMISWSQLNLYEFILREFVASGSPVFNDLHVQSEWRYYAETMDAIMTSEYPEFFVYFCSATELLLLPRNRIPVLARVAERIMMEMAQGTSNRFFAPARTGRSSLVDDLVQLHKQFVAARKMNVGR